MINDQEFLSLKDRVDALERGVISGIGEVTLAANTTTTVVQHYGCSASSYVGLTPMTSQAAAQVAVVYTTPAKGQFTITHNNAANALRKFRYVIFSGIRP